MFSVKYIARSSVLMMPSACVLFAIAELFVHLFDMYNDPGIAEAVYIGIFDK